MKAEKIETYKSLLAKYGNGGQLLDIATGHGKYAVTAALLGYDVTAFDARPDRVPEYYPGIKWEICNLKGFSYKGFNIINSFGILYHLHIEWQEWLLKQINYATVISDTHYSTPAAVAKRGLKVIGEYAGIECSEGPTLESLKTRPLNAFDDLVNYCHTEESLYRLFDNCGFRVVETAWVTDDRNFYVLQPK